MLDIVELKDCVGKTIVDINLDSDDGFICIKFSDNTFSLTKAGSSYDSAYLIFYKKFNFSDFYSNYCIEMGLYTQEEYDDWAKKIEEMAEEDTRKYKLQQFNRLKEELGL